MASTTFVNGVTLSDGTGWANDVDYVTYDGATTQVLVGGGAGVLAVWTTATGTGAPVRAGAPTFTSNITFSAASAKIIPGATSLLFRNNADSASNIVITDAGEITLPLQPAFLAYNSASDDNVTGNGTTVTVDFDTEVFDQGGDFASDTFTAPVTGRYQLSAGVQLGGLTGATQCILTIVTSNRTYEFRAIRTMGGTEAFALSVLADMDAADTAIVRIYATGIGADTADVTGGATLDTFFSGHLAC